MVLLTTSSYLVYIYYCFLYCCKCLNALVDVLEYIENFLRIILNKWIDFFYMTTFLLEEMNCIIASKRCSVNKNISSVALLSVFKDIASMKWQLEVSVHALNFDSPILV